MLCKAFGVNVIWRNTCSVLHQTTIACMCSLCVVKVQLLQSYQSKQRMWSQNNTLCVLQQKEEQADAGRSPQQGGPVLEVHVGV